MDTHIEKLMDMARSAEQRMDIDERDALWAAVFSLSGVRRPRLGVEPTSAGYICMNVPQDEIYAQLAEEAAELAHAALKMRRVINGQNPTPVDSDDAFESVLEEVNDVLAVLDVLHIRRDDERVWQKLKRWKERLDHADKKLHDGD